MVRPKSIGGRSERDGERGIHSIESGEVDGLWLIEKVDNGIVKFREEWHESPIRRRKGGVGISMSGRWTGGIGDLKECEKQGEDGKRNHGVFMDKEWNNSEYFKLTWISYLFSCNLGSHDPEVNTDCR